MRCKAFASSWLVRLINDAGEDMDVGAGWTSTSLSAHPADGVDMLHLGQVFADLLEDCRKFHIGEHQRICGEQLDGAGVGATTTRQIAL